MNEPRRIQRKRTKGWRMPQGAIYVGRPTKWGNHYAIGDQHPGHGLPMTREDVVEEYGYDTRRADAWIAVRDHIRECLRGKDLACWCPLDQPCHADVLLEIANS